MAVLSPFVYWAQSEANIFIKVDLKDVNVSKIATDTHGLGNH